MIAFLCRHLVWDPYIKPSYLLLTVYKVLIMFCSEVWKGLGHFQLEFLIMMMSN